MKIVFFSLLLLTLISFEIKAQNCESSCHYYNNFIKMAQADTVKNTQTKLNYYRAAIVAAKDCNCPKLEQNAHRQIDTLFIVIEEEKRKAETLSKMVLEQQGEIKEALKNAEDANEKNIKIIEAMDFYDGKFALAFKNDKYGFIDEDGNTKLDFKYDKGEPFDKEIGFAEMEIISQRTREATKYLLDTIGNMYELFDMNEEYMIGVRNKVIKNNKKAKSKANHESINQELYTSFGRYGAIALNFKDIKKNSALRILECLAKGEDTKDRVEVIIWKADDLFTFPDVIMEFSNLKYIYMYWTEIKSIPNNIDRLKNLKKIKLPFSVETLPSNFYNLENLEVLDISETKMKALPEKVENLKNLKEARFPFTLETLPSNFYRLENLEILDLFFAKINEIPKEIGNLKKLRKLELPSSIEKLSSKVYSLDGLETLHIYGAEPEYITREIGNLKKLKDLVLQVPIERLPKSIGNLIKLEELDLTYGKMTGLPESIGHLKNLKSLQLPRNLETIPESIGHLINVKELNLCQTKITKLPESIGKMRRLEKLYLPPKLNALPEGIGKLKNLEFLFFPTDLEAFPECIGNLTHLKKLDISNDQNFKEIPDISEFQKLEHFYLVLYEDENYTENIATLKKLKKNLPNCVFHIRDKNGEKMEMFNSY